MYGGPTSSVLERKAPFVHFVLFNDSTGHKVQRPWRVRFLLQRTRPKSPLFANQNVKVVVGCMHTTVPFRPEGSTEDDEVFGDTRVDDVHCPHGSAGVVENPFTRVEVKSNIGGGVRRGKVGGNVLDHTGEVVGMGGDGGLGELVEVVRVEDIPSVLLVGSVLKFGGGDSIQSKNRVP